MAMEGANEFDWLEYIVFGVMLLLSALIGVFFWCYKGGQHTVDEYYLGNKQMSVYPVAMSMVASFISGISLMGLPSEVYNNGCTIVFACLAEAVIFTLNITLYQPVFYNLQIISLYEYLERRFDHKVRVLASALNTVAWLLYLPVVIYGPALAFNQVTGLSLHFIAPLICLVCIFYTSVGGLKAVVWADALQSTIMLGAIVIVVIVGATKVGGVGTVFTTAYEGSRLDVFNFDFDPTVRLTFWSATIGITFNWLSDVTSPVQVQRYLSLPNLQSARKASFLYFLGMCMFYLFSIFNGLVIYTNYLKCDPLLSKKIIKKDQILPYFVLDVAGHLKGLPGLFIAGIVCAALSSLSSGMNTLAGTIYEDLIEPITGKKSERTASNIMKVLSIAIGITCTVLVNVVDKLGTLTDVAIAVSGSTGGSIFGIFTMGLLMPRINAKGAFFGGLVSAIFILWTMLGHELSPNCNVSKAVSIEGCSNMTDLLPIPESTCPDVSTTFKYAFPLYRVSQFFYGLIGCSVCFFVGFVVSYLTGLNDPADIEQELLSPIIRDKRKIKNKTYVNVPLKEQMSVQSS